MTKVNGELSRLIIRDLARFSGLKFTHPDRLTREEAGQVARWAKGHPEVQKAFMNKAHPEHGAVRLYADVVRHFEHEHPASSMGVPEPWPATPTGRPRGEETSFRELSPEDAAARLAWAATKPEFRAAMNDKNHPQHRIYLDQVSELNHVITGETPPAPASAAPASTPPAGTAPVAAGTAAPGDAVARHNAEGEIARLRADPEFQRMWLNRQHPAHKDALDRMARLYEAAYPEPAPEGAGTAASPLAAPTRATPKGTPQDALSRLETLKRDSAAALFDGGHPDHGAAVDAVTRAYEAAYPEPAPAAGGAAA